MKGLTVDQLTIRLNDSGAVLVNGLSLDVRCGESLVLLGQSGCGKTMTCRAVMGLLDKRRFAVEGSVDFCGTELLGLAESRRAEFYGSRIAFIPQNPMTALDPSRRVGRQMDETLRIHTRLSRGERRERVRSSLIKAGLPDTERILRSYPYTLSGGMLQRVLIAIATSTDADLIVADEPTTALDVVHRNETVDAFLRLRQEGAAVLFVTHDFAAALRLGGKVLVMREGRVVESGNTGEVYAAPRTAYTKALVKASALAKGEARADS